MKFTCYLALICKALFYMYINYDVNYGKERVNDEGNRIHLDKTDNTDFI